MITDDDVDANDDAEADAEEPDPLIKCEVKEEVDEVNSDADIPWNDDFLQGGSIDDGVVKEEEEEVNNESRSRKRRNAVRKISNKYKRQRAEKQSANLNGGGNNTSEDEEHDDETRIKRRKYSQKKKDDEDWNESMEYCADRRKTSSYKRRLPHRATKKKVSPPSSSEYDFSGDEDNSRSGEGNPITDNAKGATSSLRKLGKKKDNDSDELKQYCVERVNARKSKERSLPKKSSTVLQMPEIFSTLEEFTEYMEKRVEASVETAIDDGEDPCCHHHFYLAVHECLQAGLKQGLISPQEADDAWKKYDEFARQKYESVNIQPEIPKKKKQRVVGRRYIRVDRVQLKEEEYQDMLRKTRRMKTLIVRDYVLKSVEENNGENKIRNDLTVRREFFEMLLDVPGSDSKMAVLSSIKNLWKHLVYGKKDDWSKYLTNKEKVLEKRKELMNPDNVKIRRYLYRQAYIASLPKEEIERRNQVRRDYFKEKRSNLSEEKRKELREKNRQWRNSLTGERRDKYIEKVYSAIRKRNERLKYERAGLTPPPELLPVRKGRNTASTRRTQNARKEKEVADILPTSASSSSNSGLSGRGRGRGRSPRKFGTGQRIVPSISAPLLAPTVPHVPIVAPLVPPRPPLDMLLSFSGTIPTQIQPNGLPAYPSFGATPGLDYFGHNFQQQYSQSYSQNPESFPLPMSSAISESNQSNVATPLSTPPHNYSVRDRDHRPLPIQHQERSYHEDNQGYDYDDNDPSSPPQRCEEDSTSNPTVAYSSSSNVLIPEGAPVVTAFKEEIPSQKPNTSTTPANNNTSSSTPVAGTPEICEECGMQFARSYDLRKHINFAHSEDDSNRRCPVCGKEFNLPRSLWRHIVRHHRGNTDASKEAKPKRPTRVDHGPCRCELCGKAFVTGDMRKAYRDHMRRTHNKKDKSATSEPVKPKEPRPKTVRCEFCDKEMLFISLQRHIRNAHQTGNVKSFACEECGKTFKDKRYLTDHVRLTHSFNFQKMIESKKLLVKSYSKDDPCKEVFMCTICSENIGERLEFRTHLLKKHPDVFQELSSSGAAYSKRECEVCKATFPKEIELREHLTSEHPDMCWNCPHCAKFICSQASLQKHIKNIHTLKKSKDGNEEAGKKCPKCGDLIEGGESELWMHIKAVHAEIILYCKYCNKPKWSKKLLSDHHRICRLKPENTEEDEEDSGDKVVCTVCGTKLKHQGSLDRHMREIHKVHKIEFKCEEPSCKEIFTQKSKLYDHLEQVHGNKVKRYRKKKKKKSKVDELPSPPPSPELNKRRKSERKRTQVTKYQEEVQVKVERLTEDELDFYVKTEPE